MSVLDRGRHRWSINLNLDLEYNELCFFLVVGGLEYVFG